ncbi:MAG: hypothetical protein AAGF59_06850, partial [Pseudomonadota bacterium]
MESPQSLKGTRSIERMTGAVVAALGLLLFLVVIPYDTETVEYGWVRPDTVPNATAFIIIFCGVLLALRPGGVGATTGRGIGLAIGYLLLVGAAVIAMIWFGFLPVAPVLALALMLAMGERRPLWLVGGVVVLPALI